MFVTQTFMLDKAGLVFSLWWWCRMTKCCWYIRCHCSSVTWTWLMLMALLWSTQLLYCYIQHLCESLLSQMGGAKSPYSRHPVNKKHRGKVRMLSLNRTISCLFEHSGLFLDQALKSVLGYREIWQLAPMQKFSGCNFKITAFWLFVIQL